MGAVFLFFVGFGLAITGGISLIMYLNFLPAGLMWSDYFAFIITRIECYFLPLGILIMWSVLYRYSNNP